MILSIFQGLTSCRKIIKMMKLAFFFFFLMTCVARDTVTLALLYLGQFLLISLRFHLQNVSKATRLKSLLINWSIIYRFVRHHRESGEASFQMDKIKNSEVMWEKPSKSWKIHGVAVAFLLIFSMEEKWNRDIDD